MKNNYKDFRCGNLVKYDGRVFEIDTIAKEFPTLNTMEFGIGVVGWNNIEQIELGEENIVSLFGFRKVKYSMLASVFTNDKLELANDFSISYNGRRKIIRYVRELQNIYFDLVDFELTLNK